MQLTPLYMALRGCQQRQINIFRLSNELKTTILVLLHFTHTYYTQKQQLSYLQINGALEQAQDTISNSSVVLELLWEDQNKEKDLSRTEKDDRDKIGGIEENESLEETIEDNDEVDDEIQSIEKEVEEVEAVNYLEDSNYETEAEKEIKTKTKEILELMETIQEDNNVIIR